MYLLFLSCSLYSCIFQFLLTLTDPQAIFSLSSTPFPAPSSLPVPDTLLSHVKHDSILICVSNVESRSSSRVAPSVRSYATKCLSSQLLYNKSNDDHETCYVARISYLLMNNESLFIYMYNSIMHYIF